VMMRPFYISDLGLGQTEQAEDRAQGSQVCGPLPGLVCSAAASE